MEQKIIMELLQKAAKSECDNKTRWDILEELEESVFPTEQEEEDETPPRRGGFAWVLVTILAVAAVVAIALGLRFGMIGGKPGADTTQAVPAVAGKAAPRSVEPVATPVPPPAIAKIDSAVAPAIAQAPPTAAETRATDIGATVPASGVPFSGLGTGPRPSPTIGTEAAPNSGAAAKSSSRKASSERLSVTGSSREAARNASEYVRPLWGEANTNGTVRRPGLSTS